ncbi:hypothetical protein JTE90_019170 [Oedothorax gibbosus]|uniref:Uncharacterized protein n=1 Tax=Oedothorax gibbosus TaxID=931172 RepID=A0AAV6USJ0_9ARAC|nr:hypothetical protein JTE90_019170 [Oedothorax gibbosus]
MTVRTLSKVVIPVFMNSETSWTLEKNHLYVAFRAEGYHVPEDVIDLPDIQISGPDPKIEGCDFAVHVTINDTEKVEVRCRVFHIKPGVEIAKISDDVYLDKNEPILEEQREMLDKMPIPEILNDPSANISLVEKYRIQYIN